MSKNFNQKQASYFQIKEDILEKINNKEFLPGESIPSESDLSDEYGVSRFTVRAALLELQRDGLLYSVKGKGVYVIGEAVSRDLDKLTGFTRSMKKLNLDPKNSLINSFIREAGPYYAKIFDIDETEEIHYIKRLSTVDDEPVSIEELYIPTKILPNLMNINTNDFSMYDIYDYYGIKFTNADQILDISTVDQNEARLLDISTDTPVFLLRCLTYSEKTPIEYSVSYVRGDKYRFISEFNRDFDGY